TTGAVDASCFLHLGNVFSSVITGNLVLLGVSAATQSASLAIHSGVALAGYSAGVLVGAPIATRRARGGETWALSVSVTLGGELAAIGAGGLGGGLVAEHAPAWLPAAIMTPLAVVVIASITGFDADE